MSIVCDRLLDLDVALGDRLLDHRPELAEGGEAVRRSRHVAELDRADLIAADLPADDRLALGTGEGAQRLARLLDLGRRRDRALALAPAPEEVAEAHAPIVTGIRPPRGMSITGRRRLRTRVVLAMGLREA